MHCHHHTDTDITHEQRAGCWRNYISGLNYICLNQRTVKEIWLKWEGNILQCPFERGCLPALKRRMPDASWWYLSPSYGFISYTLASQWSPVYCPLFVVTTGDIFQECSATTKPHFSLDLSSLLNCPCPQADWALLALLLPSPSLPLSWKHTFIGQGDSQQTCTLPSAVIICNVFRLDVFF